MRKPSKYHFYLILATILFFTDIAISLGQEVVTTFTSAGIRWKSDLKHQIAETCPVQFRKSGRSDWQNGLPLWYDKRDSEYRGSIIDLEPGSDYEFRLIPENSADTLAFRGKTWREDFPVADTVYLPAYSDSTLRINGSGSKDGYILYTPRPGDSAIIDVKHRFPLGIDVLDGVSHVIIRGVSIRGAAQHGIRIRNNVHDLIIENNDISGWGTMAGDGFGENRNSAIFSAQKDSAISRIIVQHNYLHHPATNANSWEEARADGNLHPAGPQAIHLAETRGNLVIRFNDIYSDSLHYFNDGIGAAENFGFRGFPNQDSDIYGNKISHCWDDGIESEGANRNVRIWSNYIDKTYIKIAIATTSVGPLYIYRNVSGSSKKSHLKSSSDETERGPFIKAGGLGHKGIYYGGGKTYVYHNTMYQEYVPGLRYPLGSGSAIQASGGSVYNLETRNNLFLSFAPFTPSFLIRGDSCKNDFDYDLYSGNIRGVCRAQDHQKNGLKARNYDIVWFDTLKTNQSFALNPASPAVDAGIAIPNFNDGFLGKAPDLGALEIGERKINFGAHFQSRQPRLFGIRPIWLVLVGFFLSIITFFIVRKRLVNSKL